MLFMYMGRYTMVAMDATPVVVKDATFVVARDATCVAARDVTPVVARDDENKTYMISSLTLVISH